MKIGANVTLMPGRTIGDGAKIDAGLIIDRDIKKGEIVRNLNKIR